MGGSSDSMKLLCCVRMLPNALLVLIHCLSGCLWVLFPFAPTASTLNPHASAMRSLNDRFHTAADTDTHTHTHLHPHFMNATIFHNNAPRAETLLERKPSSNLDLPSDIASLLETDDDLIAFIRAAETSVSDTLRSRSMSENMEFWLRLTNLLDKPTYLSRTKRWARQRGSALRRARKKSFVERMRARLSITYGHAVPCAYSDRYYCMNGGTCVFVEALDIKSCRCTVGYTGVRCEEINQDYILSLLAEAMARGNGEIW